LREAGRAGRPKAEVKKIIMAVGISMTSEKMTPLSDFERCEREIVEAHKDGNDAAGIVARVHPTIEEWRKFVGAEIRRDPALEPNQWINAMARMFAVMALEATSIFPERKMRRFAMTKLVRKMVTMICEVFDGTIKVEGIKTSDQTQEIVTSEGIFWSKW
jgi:hypothetical protein